MRTNSYAGSSFCLTLMCIACLTKTFSSKKPYSLQNCNNTDRGGQQYFIGASLNFTKHLLNYDKLNILI